MISITGALGKLEGDILARIMHVVLVVLCWGFMVGFFHGDLDFAYRLRE